MQGYFACRFSLIKRINGKIFSISTNRYEC